MLRPIKGVILTTLAGLAVCSAQAAAPTLSGADVGAPGVPGSLTITNDAGGKPVYVVTGSGGDIWNTADNFYYAYFQATGDFDYVVKVASHVGSSGDGGWSKAELMARLDDGSGIPQGGDPFIANMATRPASDTNGVPAGSNNRGPQWRAVRDDQCSWTAPSPAYRPNMDHNWLRLERVGNVIYMYTSDDGKAWNMYNPYSPQGWDTSGSWPPGTDNAGVSVFTEAWRSDILFGLAVTGHNDSDVSTVVFTDFGPYTPVPVAMTSAPPATVSVAQNTPLTLTVAATGDPVHYQWLKNGTAIAQAVGPTYKVDLAQLSDAGMYRIRVFGGGKEVTSDTVVTVTPDTTAPTVAKVIPDVTFANLLVKFSEPITDTALTASNYSIDKGMTVSTVSRVDAFTVQLATSKMAESTIYNLTINGVRDTATPGNPIAANTKFQFQSFVFVSGSVLHKKYNSVSDGTGSTTAGLFDDPRYPNLSDRQDFLPMWEYPFGGAGRVAADPARNYFDTIEGYFIPPTTGNYVFFTAGADRWWLFLSTDETPANMHVIAAQPNGWTNPRGWNTAQGTPPADVTQHRSDSFSGTEWPEVYTIHLTQGQRYYMLSVHHDPSWCGADDFAVTYKLEADADPANGTAPNLTGSNIGTYVDPNGISLTITQQPSSVSILENKTAAFSVVINSSWSTPLYQWQKAPAGGAFTDIVGATQSSYSVTSLVVADSGTRFRVTVSVPGQSLISDEATVTVSSDKEPPALVSAARQFIDDTKVTVVFSELVDAASANVVANYQINGGITVSAAALAADGKSVVLTTSSIAKGTALTLTVNNVKDLAGNLIAAGSQTSVGLQRAALFVVAATGPSAGDGVLRDRLQANGYYVEVVNANVDNVSMATGKDIVIVSSSITSGDVGGTYKNVAAPVILWENAIQDDMAMTTVTGTTDRGTTAGQTSIDIVDPTHPIAVGLSAGPVTVTTASAEFVWGQPGANAKVVARLAGNASNATIYTYDKGALLTDGTPAAERRVLFLMTDNTASVMNDTAFKMWDAAVNWAQNLTGAQSAPRISSVSVANGNITIQWSNGGTLQSTSSLQTPATWDNEAGSGSFTAPATGPAKFFRVVR